MFAALKTSWAWLLSAIAVVGAGFAFLFFGIKAEVKVDVVWLLAAVFVWLVTTTWLLGAVRSALTSRSSTTATIVSAFSETGNAKEDLSFLLERNENFSSLQKCSIFQVENGLEIFMGSAVVWHIQDDGRVQVKVLARQPSGAWAEIEQNNKVAVERVRIKIGERMS